MDNKGIPEFHVIWRESRVMLQRFHFSRPSVLAAMFGLILLVLGLMLLMFSMPAESSLACGSGANSRCVFYQGLRWTWVPLFHESEVFPRNELQGVAIERVVDERAVSFLLKVERVGKTKRTLGFARASALDWQKELQTVHSSIESQPAFRISDQTWMWYMLFPGIFLLVVGIFVIGNSGLNWSSLTIKNDMAVVVWSNFFRFRKRRFALTSGKSIVIERVTDSDGGSVHYFFLEYSDGSVLPLNANGLFANNPDGAEDLVEAIAQASGWNLVRRR